MPATLSITPLVHVQGRTTNHYGTGEAVDIDVITPPAGIGLVWHLLYGDQVNVRMSSTPDGRRARLVFLYDHSAVVQVKVVRADNGHQVAMSPRLKIVAPSDWKLAKPFLYGHKHGTASAGFKSLMVMKNPHKVSFDNLVVNERACNGVGTGYLMFKNGNHHPQGPPLSVRGFNSDGQRVPDGWVAFGSDRVSSGAYGTHHQNADGDDRPYRAGGSFTWRIKWAYRVDLSHVTSATGNPLAAAPRVTLAREMVHKEVLSASGKLKISKGGQKYTRRMADNSDNAQEFWP
jgi:hypothetical protein